MHGPPQRSQQKPEDNVRSGGFISKISSGRGLAQATRRTCSGRGWAGVMQLDGAVWGVRAHAGAPGLGSLHPNAREPTKCSAAQTTAPLCSNTSRNVPLWCGGCHETLEYTALGCHCRLGVGLCGVSPPPPRSCRRGLPKQNDRVLRLLRLSRRADKLRQSRLPRLSGAPSGSELEIAL